MTHAANHDTGMDHGKHAGHSVAMFRNKFWVSAALTVPVLAYSMHIQSWLSFTPPALPGSEYIPLALGSLIFFYGGAVFLRGAAHELKARRPGMMTLISLAITVAYVYSAAVELGMAGEPFFWELATLVTIMLLGHWLEMASVQSAQNALNELSKLLPDTVELITKKGLRIIPLSALKVGDQILVRPGSQVPVDGKVIKGRSRVNESMLTGESRSVVKKVGADVIGGTINDNGSLTIEARKIGDDTVLSGIMRLVQEAATSKSRTQILADKAAFYLTFVAIGAAFITLIGWTVFGDKSATFVLERIVTVLVIACPHALGLAIPLVTAISTTLAAKNGLLVRERISLETARDIDVVLFDKTGTLTEGRQGVVDIYSPSMPEDKVIALAAAVEQDSEHPIAKAVLAYAKKIEAIVQAPRDFSALAGKGAMAKLGNKTVYVGGPSLLKELGIILPPNISNAAGKANNEGKTVVYVIRGKEVLGAIMLADTIREESISAIRYLRDSGKRVVMLTGDSKEVAQWVAGKLDITEYFAEVLPENKARVVQKLQADGSKVAMVGDGVNDAPALVQANVGIAIGAGTDVAIESAGIVLASSDPRGILKVIRLSRATYSKMLQNLAWATGYNIIAIPLAAGATASFGFVLSPALGAVLMSLSTVIVAINAQFLRRLRL